MEKHEQDREEAGRVSSTKFTKDYWS